ncbi:MFS transporter [Oenococcus sp.]|uniref:MFS transporter n=1 Tax=Oenococcus sp. TaxID=1979414 RepID=UPI0039EB970B
MPKRNFYSLVAIPLFFELGNVVFSFALGIDILRKTGSSINFAVTVLADPLAMLISMPFVGKIVDRYSKKKIILVCEFIAVTVLLIFSILIGLKLSAILTVAAAAITILLLRMTGLFVQVSLGAATPQLVNPDQIQKVNAINQMTGGLSNILGPILGALLLAIISIGQIAYVQVTTEILVLLLSLSLVFSKEKAADIADKLEKVKHEGSLKAAWLYLKTQTSLFALLLAAAAANLLLGFIDVGMPISLVRQLQASNQFIAFNDGALSLGVILAGIALSIMKRPVSLYLSTRLIKYGMLVAFSILTLLNLLPVNTSIYQIAVLTTVFFLGVIVSLASVPLLTHTQLTIKKSMLGRVLSLQDGLMMVLAPAGIVLSSLAFQFFTIWQSFAVGLVLSLFAVILPSTRATKDH